MATIYAGGKPIKGLGRNMFHTLEFALKYPGWHSVGRDTATRAAVARLTKRKLIEYSRATEQFRFDDTRA